MFETQAPSSEDSGITPGFADLAPETRNAIYALSFDSPSPFFVVAAHGPRPRFKLRERSEESQYDAVSALQAFGAVSRAIRQEVRTFFYATRQFIVLPYGYEYLPIFVRWLDSIGPQCRGVLQNVYFAGYMYYHQSGPLTKQFHDLLRSCKGLRKLGVHINIWHLCEACSPSLSDIPNPRKSPLPEIDMMGWAETVVRLPELQAFKLELVLSVDKRKEARGVVRSYSNLSNGRGILFAEAMESTLRGGILAMGTGSVSKVEVRYTGTDKRDYHNIPW